MGTRDARVDIRSPFVDTRSRIPDPRSWYLFPVPCLMSTTAVIPSLRSGQALSEREARAKDLLLTTIGSARSEGSGE